MKSNINVLILGNGSREHIIIESLLKSKHNINLYLNNFKYSIKGFYNKFGLENVNQYNLKNITQIQTSAAAP